MNKMLLRYGIIVGVCLGQVTSQTAHAQGTLYLSHLGSSIDTGLGTGNNFWYGQEFKTGSTAGGYSLDSFQLRIAGVGANPSGFTVSLYSDNGGAPGSSLEGLSGSQPTGLGVFTFTSSGVNLLPSTEYWAVATSPGTAGGPTTTYWAIDPDTYTSSDNWSMTMTGIARSSDGTSWDTSGSGSPLTLAVNATPAPEPKIDSLLALGLFAIAWQRKNRKNQFPNAR